MSTAKLLVLFSKVNFWVQKEILSGKTMKARGEVLSHFIKIAKVTITAKVVNYTVLNMQC